jgi:hypothetical protein
MEEAATRSPFLAFSGHSGAKKEKKKKKSNLRNLLNQHVYLCWASTHCSAT